MSKMKSCAVIAAAGSGTRMGGVSKPNIKLLGKTLFEYVLEAINNSQIDEVVVVCSEDNKSSLTELSGICQKEIKFVIGGATRAQSVFNGVSASGDDVDVICAHDCARPFITSDIINETVNVASKFGASCVCAPVVDTLKYKNPETGEISTPNRDNMFSVQTPQCFKKSLYLKAKDFAGEKLDSFTDETSLLENCGIEVKYLKYTQTNMKLTALDDVPIAEILMKRRVITND